MDPDARGFSVALVAAELEEADSVDVIAVLERSGWGVMLLPPTWYPDDAARELLDQVAEQVHEFARQRYRLALIGSRSGLSEALHRVGVEMPAAIDPVNEQALEAFLGAL